MFCNVEAHEHEPMFNVAAGALGGQVLVRYEHLVRYVGWYSNRARGARAKKGCLPAGVAMPSADEELANEFAARAKATWTRLIRKV